MTADPDGNKSVDRRFTLQAAGTVLLGSLAGCSFEDAFRVPETTEESPATTQTLTGGLSPDHFTITQAAAPDGLDPVVRADRASRMVFQHLFEGLYGYDGGMTPAPRLATGQPTVSDGGRRWTVELRPEARFQHGQPVRARDVKYSFERPVAENTAADKHLEHVERIAVVDERSVRFELGSPRSSFIHTLTHPVVPRERRERDRTAFDQRDPVGSGVFELEAWTDTTVRLRRWPGYWGSDRPVLEKLEFAAMSGGERVESLRDGASAVIELGPADVWSAARNVSDAVFETAPRVEYYYFACNCREGPTADRRVREAIDFVFDMGSAVEEVVAPVGVRQYSPVPRAVAEAWEMPVERWKQIPHGKDLEKAAALFDEADVPLDYPWRIVVPPDDRRERIARVIADGLSEAGFTDVSVDRLEWGAFYGTYTTGKESDYNLYALGWANRPDPDMFTYYLFGRTPQVLGRTNGTFYGAHSERGKEAAEKFARARESLDRTTRRRLYVDGITLALEDRAHLPAYTLTNNFAMNTSVTELTVVPTTNQLHFRREQNSTQPS